MAISIDKKIVGYSVAKKDDAETQAEEKKSSEDNVVQMHEKVERPEFLSGSTYKVKTPLSDHSLYITINDMILNHGTEHEHRRPFEIFINSKNMDQFQWVVALTRVISAVFRKGGDVTFLAEELQAVFDPKGGYFKKGGKFMPSLVAEIGETIEIHLRSLGMMGGDELTEQQKKLISEKRAEYESKNSATKETADQKEESPFPEGAQLCSKCNTKAVILMDGCMTCLNCSDSKCG
ncbi:MAG: NrdJb [Gammaproteobacteria bacterium]|nr:MAG: NrdJb [Gammaproteobacteria bacterium]